MQLVVFPFPHGEGEDVRWVIAREVLAIELRDFIIVDQEDAQLTLVTLQVA